MPVMIGSVACPLLIMIVHMAVTDDLSAVEKAVWRSELWVGHRALPAALTYLLVGDLKKATQEMAESRA
jgi:hypothetical protein